MSWVKATALAFRTESSANYVNHWVKELETAIMIDEELKEQWAWKHRIQKFLSNYLLMSELTPDEKSRHCGRVG